MKQLAVECVELRAAMREVGHDVRTLVEQRAGDGEADALRGARHDGDATVEVEIHALKTTQASET